MIKNLTSMVGPVLTVVLSMLHASCAGSNGQPWPSGDSSYVFATPDARFDLKKDLKEISGLTTLKDGTLAAIEDESGALFILDPTSGDVIARKKFAKRGDFEGLELAGDRLYALRSDGRLFMMDDWSGADIKSKEEKLDLPKRCDAEGLAFDGSRLLISCKEEPGKDLKRVKAIYSLDPATMKVSDDPAFIIDPKEFSASVKDHAVNEAVRSVMSERVDLSGFKPAGMAIHPITRELYVVSSVRQAILALDRGGNVTKIWALPDGLMEQPESIAFLPNGDLFVASEAGGGKSARLFRFNYRVSGSESQP